jgi:hypothetical protein
MDLTRTSLTGGHGKVHPGSHERADRQPYQSADLTGLVPECWRLSALGRAGESRAACDTCESALDQVGR